MNKKLRNMALLMGAALFGVSGIAGAESLGTPIGHTSTAALVCNPGSNVIEGSYGAWVANGAPGHVVCDSTLLKPLNNAQGVRTGNIVGRGAANARICGSNDDATVGGCFAAYAQHTSATPYNFTPPATLPANSLWTQRYVAVFLDSATSRVNTLK